MDTLLTLKSPASAASWLSSSCQEALGYTDTRAPALRDKSLLL
jgi:hypothetical protein